MTGPLTIENRWDILYRDYPEVYDAFSNTPYFPTVYEELTKILGLAGKDIADVGSGTGNSSLALARLARHVFGIEKESQMLHQAIEKTAEGGLGQVSFLAGDALALPLANASVHLVVGVTLALYPPELYRQFVHEGLRAAREQVVYVGIPPGWYGGELAHVVGHDDPSLAVIEKILLEEFNFSYHDIISVQNYGSLEHIVNTYGFIFGRKAIDYLQQGQKTTIRWKFRVYHRKVSS